MKEYRIEKDIIPPLLAWYDGAKRILPWRETRDPYNIWVSEIMLQQTRVEAVKPYYDRFLQALPTVRDLAGAEESYLLKLWEGLGYYSRVRNLHKAAVMIMEEYGGEMPSSASELVKLPGIGPYSAAAIASIAFQQPEVSVDGNLLRVFARMTEYGEDIKAPAARKAALAYYEERIASVKRPGDFNQALMDLGAGICLPNGVPLCAECPWAERCRAHQTGRETEFPAAAMKKARKQEDLTVFLIHAGNLVAIHRRPDDGLLAGLWEFPNVPGHLREEEAKMSLAGMKLCREPEFIRKLPAAKHIFSHIEWHMTGYEIRLPELSGEELEELREEEIYLVSHKELTEHYSIPSAFEKYKRYEEKIRKGGVTEPSAPA